MGRRSGPEFLNEFLKFHLNLKKMTYRVCALVVACALLSRQGADGFAIRVDAHEEECFYETVTAGTKVSTTLAVLQM